MKCCLRPSAPSFLARLVSSLGLSSLLAMVGGCSSDAGGGERLATNQAKVTVTHTAFSVGTGIGHTCALLDNNQIKCWGGNWAGQLGYGDISYRGDQTGEMGTTLRYIDLGSQYSAKAVAVGDEHTCAILDDGLIKCWGNNAYGQLGLGDTNSRGDNPNEMGNALPAVNLGMGRTATAIAAGGYHTCALLDHGEVKCWGKNTYGQLGLGDTNHRGDNPNEMAEALPAVNLGTNRSAIAITAGWGHTCALLNTGEIKCWGGNGYGQLGQGDQVARGDNPGEMGDTLHAILLRSVGNTVQGISAGYLQTCAVMQDRTVKCWGRNDFGQLGLGDTNNRGDQAGEMGDQLPAVDLEPGMTAFAVTTGRYHTCALLKDRSVKCWGANGYGQLGLGDTVTRGDNPGEMGSALPRADVGSTVILTTRDDHTCAVLDNGQLKCWGFNQYGSLGQGSTANRGDNPNEMGTNLPAIDLGYGLLASKFFKSHPSAIAVMSGPVFDVNDPSWFTSDSNYNKRTFTYKILAALHMLGYNTKAGTNASNTPAIALLEQFQAAYGFPVETLLRANVLAKMDSLIAQKEPTFASIGRQFLLYNHMQPLARNDVSRDFVAMIYTLPMQVLPSTLQMGLDETVQCINGQCVGSIEDAYGNPWPTFPVNLTQDYRFVGAYYDPFEWNWMSQLFSASVNVQTVLHEFGHYIDGKRPHPVGAHEAIVNTAAFYNIAYDMSQVNPSGCAPRRSSNIADWLSRYGYLAYGDCPAGWGIMDEDWAESFAFYVTAGRRFRAAAALRPMIAARYNFIKTQVFAGVEFNTDLQAATHSGCNDAPGYETQQPAYVSCSETAVWDGTLPKL